MDLLRVIASVEKFDVIAIWEAWLNSADKDFVTEFQINGYNVYHKDRTGRLGGGVKSYVDMITSYVSSAVKSDVNMDRTD